MYFTFQKEWFENNQGFEGLKLLLSERVEQIEKNPIQSDFNDGMKEAFNHCINLITINQIRPVLKKAIEIESTSQKLNLGGMLQLNQNSSV